MGTVTDLADRMQKHAAVDYEVGFISALEANPVFLERRLAVVSWSRLSEQNLRVDKWSLCRG